MSTLKHLQFRSEMHAAPAVVWHHVTDPASYSRWTSAFAEGSRFEGSWTAGSTIRFVSPTGDGMLSEIVESREPEFLSIRHLGVIANGVEDTTSDAVLAWAPVHESYTFLASGGGTTFIVDQDVPDEWAGHLADAWPRALQLLATLCEAGPAA